jgi:hypothetical protein
MTMTTTTTMTATERTAKAVETKTARLEATKDRTNNRIVKATLARQKAEKAVQVANARLEKAVAKLTKTKADSEALVAKQAAELDKAVQAHEKSKASEQAKVDKANAKAEREAGKDVGGTVETESGKVINLPVAVCEVIKSAIGRRRKGVLTTKDGDEVTVLDALAKAIEPDELGVVFEVALKGRKTVVLFTLADGETRFETEDK